jgi:hypothetical protein
MLIPLPLTIACLAVVLVLSLLASKGKLHIPGYIGIAFLAFILSLIFGKLSGMKAVHGSITALALSVACYLCIAATIGSLVALAFYRERVS